MKLTINGQEKIFAGEISLLQLLEELAINPDQVVVELNSAILTQEQRTTALLNDGDTLELVQFVGGG